MASILNWIKSNTIGITEAVRQLLYVGIVFEILAWNDTQQTAVLQGLSAVLAVIAAKTNVSAPKVDERIINAKAQSYSEGHKQGTDDSQ